MLVIFWVFFASGLILKGNFLKDYAIILGNLAYYNEYKRPCFFTLSGTYHFISNQNSRKIL